MTITKYFWPNALCYAQLVLAIMSQLLLSFACSKLPRSIYWTSITASMISVVTPFDNNDPVITRVFVTYI